MTHDELARSLADHLAGDNRMVWTDMQLGPAGSPRPDVYTIFRSYANPSPMAYECKVSRSDFLSDVTCGKWQTYLQYACGVIFACEEGLLTKSDMPQYCGLIIYRKALDGTGRWRAAKRPILNPVVVPQDALLKLLIDGVLREGPLLRQRAWRDSMMHIDAFEKKFGAMVARTIRDRLAVEHEIRSARYQAEQMIEDAKSRAKFIVNETTGKIEPLRAELAQILGIPVDSSVYGFRAAVNELKQQKAEHPVVTRHRQLTSLIRRALDTYGDNAVGDSVAAGWVAEQQDRG